jgi:hypothetical protein
VSLDCRFWIRGAIQESIHEVNVERSSQQPLACYEYETIRSQRKSLRSYLHNPTHKLKVYTLNFY